MTLQVKTFVNDGPGRFFGYEPGDLLIEGPVLTVAVDTAPSEIEVVTAEAAFVIGNRMAAGLNGPQWPSNVRSMSVGDVVIIGEVALSCEGAGWKVIDNEFARRVSLSEFARDTSR